MWQTNCENTAVRDALLHVARSNGWAVPENWPAHFLWVSVKDSNVDGTDVIDDGTEVITPVKAFELLSKGPFPVAHFDGFTITMTIDQAKRVLSGDKCIMDELSRTIECVPRNKIFNALCEYGSSSVQNDRRMIWLAASKIMEQHYLGECDEDSN